MSKNWATSNNPGNRIRNGVVLEYYVAAIAAGRWPSVVFAKAEELRRDEGYKSCSRAI
jgi:hypothetical protein